MNTCQCSDMLGTLLVHISAYTFKWSYSDILCMAIHPWTQSHYIGCVLALPHVLGPTIFCKASGGRESMSWNASYESFAILKEWLTDSSLCHTMLTGYDAMLTSMLFCSNSIPALCLIRQLHLCKSQTTSTNGGASSLASGQVASHGPLEASLPAKKHADHLGHFASSQDGASTQNIMKSDIRFVNQFQFSSSVKAESNRHAKHLRWWAAVGKEQSDVT